MRPKEEALPRFSMTSLRATALSRGARTAAVRLSWGLGDQAVSSLTNFVVGLYVARSLGIADFGIFSLAWVTYGVALNVSRGLATDPLVVRFSGEPTARWRAAVSAASGTALLVGLSAGAVTALAGLAIGGTVGIAFVGLGLVLPALLLQDSWRFAFFAAGQGRRAFVNDLVWAAALVPAMSIATHHASVFAFIIAWGLSGAAAAAYGCVQARLLPRPDRSMSWLRQQRDLGPRYLVENVSISGATLLRAYGLGAIAGLADVGAVRGAELLMGPFLTVLMGFSLVAVPEAARVLRRSPRRLPMFCLFLAALQAAGALAWGMGVLGLLPEEAGHFLLGSAWPAASALVLPATIAVMNASFHTGAAAGLRALGASRRSMRAQLVNSAAYVVGGVVGAAVAGAAGSSWGVAGATLIGAVVWWWQLRAALDDHHAQRVGAPTQLHHEETNLS
jgi:O-antigen/teichoic acid export membrane protein